MSKARQFTLLCAEDNLLSRQMIVEYLDNDFEEIYEASDGEEALHLYYQKRPSIIISDIAMPRLDGISLVKKIRQQDKTTPIILLTAYSNTEFLLEAIELNLVKYLIKPLDDQKLDEALQRCFKLLNHHPKKLISLTERCRYDCEQMSLVCDGETIKLTHSQKRFLSLLIQHQGEVVSYREIANHVWGDKIMTDSALRSLIHNLRKIIDPNIFENISKQGYRIKIHE